MDYKPFYIYFQRPAATLFTARYVLLGLVRANLAVALLSDE